MLAALIENAGPLLAFSLVNHFYGLRAAVIASLVATVAELVRRRRRRERPSAFFIFCAILSLGFGALDLWLTTPIFFKYEAAVTNLFTAIYFGATIWSEVPLIEELAGERAKKSDAELESKGLTRADLRYYFRILTALWTVSFVLKAAAYVWIAGRYSLEEAMALRALIGNSTFYGLLAISILGGRPAIRLLSRYRLLPSQSA